MSAIKITLIKEICSIIGVCVERFEGKIDHQLGSGYCREMMYQIKNIKNTKNQYNFIIPLLV